jgi:type I restriction enzyme S subunit
MSNNWKKYSVEELVNEEIIYKPLDGNHGGTHPKGSDFIQSGIPFIMATDIINGKVDITNCKFISKEQADRLRKGFAKPGDVLITHKASIGRTAVVPEIESEYIMLTPQVTYYRVRDRAKLDAIYLKYYFNSPFFQNEINTRAGSGSTRAYIGITDQLNLTVSFPSIQEQRAISSILSAIDDKIENNLAINKTLEEMAMTLYKHWFVDFGPFQDGEFVESELGIIPKGWEVRKFNELIDKIIDNRGKTPPLSNEKTDFLLLETYQLSRNNLFPVVVKDSKAKYVSEEIYNTSKWFRKGHPQFMDVLFATVGNGIPNWSFMYENNGVCIAQNIVALRPKKDISSIFLRYSFESKRFLEQFDGYVITTAQPSIKLSDLNRVNMIVPSNEVLNSWTDVVNNYVEKIYNHYKENRSLTELRDTLLPQLISGKVRLKEFQEQLATIL